MLREGAKVFAQAHRSVLLPPVFVLFGQAGEKLLSLFTFSGDFSNKVLHRAAPALLNEASVAAVEFSADSHIEALLADRCPEHRLAEPVTDR
jgi:hypothetical protein